MSYANFFLDVYIKPYARWTPYFMGLYLGIFYYQYQECKKKSTNPKNIIVKWMFNLKEKFDKNRILRIAVEWFGMALMAFLTFILRTLQTGHKWPQIWHSLYGCL
jgi:hypothetical protein